MNKLSSIYFDPLSPDREFLTALVAIGGPAPEQHAELDACFSRLSDRLERGKFSASALRETLIGLGGPFSDPKSLVGLVLAARRHGDYGVMEQIYSNRHSEDPANQRWDAWFQATAAAEAVRYRKKFLVRYLNDVAARVPIGSRIVMLGCGSCREVFEHLDEKGPQLRFDCLDIDEEALTFARSLGERRHLKNVRLLRMDVLRFKPRSRYVRIISAGLFDYLSDRSFRILLRRLGRFLHPGGEFLIGNFSRKNVTRGPMSCAGWILRERNENELLSLSRAAGYSAHQSWVGSEETGVNLFLNIRISN
jgi:SAM-dependent methyltransferase